MTNSPFEPPPRGPGDPFFPEPPAGPTPPATSGDPFFPTPPSAPADPFFPTPPSAPEPPATHGAPVFPGPPTQPEPPSNPQQGFGYAVSKASQSLPKPRASKVGYFVYGFVVVGIITAVIVTTAFIVVANQRVAHIQEAHAKGSSLLEFSQGSEAITNLAHRTMQSVVSIPGSVNDNKGGSGVIIDANNNEATVITTANAFDADGSSELKVILPDYSSADASVIGVDQPTNIAVLKVHKGGLTPIRVNSSDNLVTGEQVFAVGNQLGMLETITSGIVSATHRPFISGDKCGYGKCIYEYFQTDAGINAGEFGGAVVDSNGDLVGLAADNEPDDLEGKQRHGANSRNARLNFAVPIKGALRIANLLKNNKKISHIKLGLYIPTDFSYIRIMAYTHFTVTRVVPNSNATRLGLRPGDKILTVNGVDITGPQQLLSVTSGVLSGDTLTVTFVHRGDSKIQHSSTTAH